MINGSLHNAITLSEGFMDLTNDAKTLARKRSEINVFLGQVSKFWKSVKYKKVPCVLLFNWYARYLDENPHVKQSAINKITTVIHALTYADLIEPDPIFQLKFETMRKAAITLAKNNKADKAPVILSSDPFAMLPKYVLRLAVVWLMTGVRYISLAELDVNHEVDPSLPFEAASGLSWRKTELPSKPLVICTCQMKNLADGCPIHTKTVEWSQQLAARAGTVLRYWQATRHSPRHTLAIAFHLCSKLLFDPYLAQIYRRHVNVIFGWSHDRKPREKDMFLYYTEDADRYTPEQLPQLVRQVVAVYDESIPIIAAKPINVMQFKLFKNWLQRLSKIQVLLSQVQQEREWHKVTALKPKSLFFFPLSKRSDPTVLYLNR